MMSEEKNPWADDCLERERFGELLLACLQAEAAFADEAFVVALTGKFGAGKSHFLRMWRDDLSLKAKKSPKAIPQVVTVNAWESDFSGEPLLALVSEISTQITGSNEDKAVDELKRGVAGFIGGARRILFDVTAGYVDEKTGFEMEGIVDAVKDGATGGDLERRGRKLFADFEARKKSLEGLRASLGKFISSRTEVENAADLKLILIVDELDRCHPRYAIEFLEAIKHVFNVKGLAVVLGVDWDQLGCTARALFGSRLDVDEYFRKFIKRRVELPAPTDKTSEKLTRQSLLRYFNSESEAWKAIVSVDHNAFTILQATFHGMGLSPRQYQSAAHLLASFLHLTKLKNGSFGGRRYYLIEFFVVALLTKHPMILKSILKNGNVRPILQRLRAMKMAEKYIRFGLNGNLIEGRIIGALKNERNHKSFESLLQQSGYKSDISTDDESLTEIIRCANTVDLHAGIVLAETAQRMMELETMTY